MDLQPKKSGNLQEDLVLLFFKARGPKEIFYRAALETGFDQAPSALFFS